MYIWKISGMDKDFDAFKVIVAAKTVREAIRKGERIAKEYTGGPVTVERAVKTARNLDA